jgi:hypothetical protein
VSRHAAFVAGTPWTGTVLWWQVGLGVALLMLAASLWKLDVGN